ncbi:single-strand DNA endonuclease protein asteroid isoform X2 [Xylocopa sonorina]|uniref:single-strand DNA endonuclease protein asteroid isoform X2 n=1 Tax=Xylocopa sonorina TaxID=1818115 RepID=UPI00403AF38E
MGIPGLTTYVNNRSYLYLKYYELHDTYLVIDGNSIICQLYLNCARCNCVFGGDYDNYAQHVSNFFDDLLKCKVTPLVVIDGGCEDKKMKTIISRTKEKIRTASFFDISSQLRMKFFPLLLTDVFKDVLREKNIRHVQCLFEADKDIAAAAKILNCPVLSLDSDFYIYGPLYIPFDTLDDYVVKSSNGNGYVLRCKIYRVEYLLHSFRGLDQSLLPLAAVLLGNDYVKRGTFKNFFRHLKLRGASRRKHNRQQFRIESTFVWLSKYTLNKAIIGVLSRLAKPWRQKILNLIEVNINGYTNASAEILIPLGFPRDYVARVNTHHLNRSFKFDEDINTLTYVEEVCEDEDFETSGEEDEDIIDMVNTLNETESMSEHVAVRNLPAWFVNEYLMARYPTYFMDLIVRRLYICSVQLEDYCYPSSITISLKIVSIIFGLLKSGINDKVRYMRYMTRNQNSELICRELQGIANIEFINELLPEWMLYVGCAMYWIKEQDPCLSHKIYLYSIFICMLFNIIDSRIGKYRDIGKFLNKYGETIKTIKEERKVNNYKPNYPMNCTVIEAYNQIDHSDCLLAAPFFISHFEMDKKLYMNPKKLNRRIVHVFAEFQNCLKHIMNLNTLLDYPYPQIKTANLFHGTLLYNLSNKFKMHNNNIEAYIEIILNMSPSLLRLFNILLLKIKPIFPLLLQNDYNLTKQKLKPKRVKTVGKNSTESDTEYYSADDHVNEPFYDANNPFSVLNNM